MKKYLVSFAFAALFFAGCKSDSGVDDLRKEIEALKSTEIASVNSQITSIKSSISDLQKVDAELKGYIKTLQDALTAFDSEIDEKYASLQKDIEDLEKADAALSKRIDELKDYCDQQNSSTREWVATTFTTLEQHSEVLEEIAAIKLQLGELGNSITTLDSSLSKKISDSEDKVMAAIGTTENSVKSWVNEQLSGYYTIAAADAKLKLLEDAHKAGDTSLAGDIKTLQESLNTAKSDLTAAYQKAIADAITENNGTINKKIADDIKAAADNLQSQINAINTRIDALESRVVALEASVAELIGMVQSIVVVPDYSDGSVKMTSSSDNIIRFEVYPLSAAKALAEKGPSVFSLDYVETETKAGSLINLPISAVYFDGEFIRISTDCSGISESIASGTAGANARLRISSGKATRSSEYFQLKGVLVKSISLDKNAYTFHTIGDELQVKATVFPSDAMCNVVEWSSDNEDVATVDQNGIVKAIGNGATTIKVTAKDGSGTQAAFAVEVIQYVTEITLSKTSLTLYRGGSNVTETLTATVNPSTANNTSVTWSSSDLSVATVSSAGLVTGKSRGTATITVSADDGSGASATCEVEVKQCVTSITMDRNQVFLEVGESTTLSVISILPDNANEKTYTWYSSDESIATVDLTGKVIAVKNGLATITAISNDGGGQFASCLINVATVLCLWSEDWTGGESGETPATYGQEGTTVYGGKTVTYSITDGDTATKLYNDYSMDYETTQLNLLLGKSGKTWTVSGIPTAGAASATLKFYVNNGNTANTSTFTVTSSTEGVSLGTKTRGTEEAKPVSFTYDITITGSVETFDLTFTNGTDSNIRLDDISVVNI